MQVSVQMRSGFVKTYDAAEVTLYTNGNLEMRFLPKDDYQPPVVVLKHNHWLNYTVYAELEFLK